MKISALSLLSEVKLMLPKGHGGNIPHLQACHLQAQAALSLDGNFL